MDATQKLVDATRRYLAGGLTLSELADVEASLVHLWPQLPAEDIGSLLMGAIEQGLAFMDDGVGTEDDLRAALERELAIVVTTVPPLVTSSTTATTQIIRLADPVAPTTTEYRSVEVVI